jgi:hypothetical protein
MLHTLSPSLVRSFGWPACHIAWALPMYEGRLDFIGKLFLVEPHSESPRWCSYQVLRLEDFLLDSCGSVWSV